MNKRLVNIFKYVSLSLFSLCSLFIIVESSLSAEMSMKQSSFIANIFRNIINETATGNKTPINPTSINIDGPSEVTLGTTITLEPVFEPKETNRKGVTYSTSSNAINLVQIGSILKVEGLELTSEPVIIHAKTENDLTTSHHLNVVARKAPTNFSATIAQNELVVGTSTRINFVINDGRTYEDNDLLNHERYCDTKCLSYTSSNPGVAVCVDGVILAKEAGSTRISIDNSDIFFDIVVIDGEVIKPTSLSVASSLTRYVYDLDYDTKEESYHTKLTPDFGLITPTDTSVRYIVEDETIARVDSEGRVFGYKRSGTTKIKVVSNMDDTIFANCVVSVEKAIVSSLSFQQSVLLQESNQIALEPTSFAPKNAYSLALTCMVEDENIISATANGRKVIVTAKAIGETILTISSVDNPSINEKITIKVAKKAMIDDTKTASFSQFVRKYIGHFALFFLTGLFGFLTFYFFLKEKFNKWIILLFSSICGLSLAIISEFAQLFALDRAASLLDIAIDGLGYLLINIIMICAVIIANKIKEKKKRKEL